MKWITAIQQHLGWKLFLSYLLVLIIGVIVLDTTAELQTPNALTRNIAQLQTLQESNPNLLAALEANFQSIVHEHLILATMVGFLAAIAASIFTTRRILQPIQAMMRASQRISAGDYHSRIVPPSQDELGALAQAFNQMAETLDRTEHRRLELISDVTHELRTPLSSIKSTLEGLVDGVIPNTPETFMDLQREVNRMQRLVRDLEELSRAEAGQIPLELGPIEMAELIGIVAERLRLQFEDKGVVLVFDVAPNLPCVKADANRMTQVLLNLLGNALQYTPPGGTVTAHAWHDRAKLSIAIQDTGIGITSENLAHIFERFYRVDKSRSRAGGGSGIGLTIAKHLIEAHGGRISAASPGLNQGSTFTIEMPIAP
ncbi:MAG: HAMP domain-containing protein [Chloroflexi bacterium]|nr:HAMP domain-containing protein [Chloroflexota bacterium]